MANKLTPIYFIRYAMDKTEVRTIQERVLMYYGKCGTWTSQAQSFSKEEAVRRLDSLKRKGFVWAQAYHAGFKERGFRVGNRISNSPEPKDAVEDSIEFGTYPEEARHFS